MMVLTVLSCAAALVMSAVAWRVTSEAKRRSDARVAALAAELGETPPSESAAAPHAWSDPSGSASRGMFAPTADPPRAGGRWAMVVMGGAVVVVVVLGTIVTLSLRGRSSEAAPTATGAAAAQPLELISLAYERAGDELVVKGFVRNPAGAKPVTRISAVVFLFDRDGTFLTSGKALVDFLTLTPGEESPFVVQLPGGAAVGRYRVSFRKDDGTVMPHVDRRSAIQAVRRQES